MVDVDLAARDVGVVVVVDVDIGRLRQGGQRLLGRAQRGDIRSVQVDDAILHQAEADALAVVVEDRHLALVLRLPRNGPGVGQVRGRARHVVVAPRDAGRVDRVRHGVLPVLVVERILELVPGQLDVRDVAVVQRPDLLCGDQRSQHVDGRDEDVEPEIAGVQFGQRVFHGVERGDFDIAVVALLEVLHDGSVDVRHPVVDLQRRVLLRRQPAGDRRVVGVPRPGHRVVRTRQRPQRAAASQWPVDAAGQRGSEAGQGSETSPAPEQLAPGQALPRVKGQRTPASRSTVD